MDEAILQRLGRDPIAGDNPSGADIRLSEDYQTIQSQIERLSAIAGVTGGVDWPLVVSTAEKILSSSSKDLSVAVYMCVGLIETRPLEILASVADFLADLVENYWDSLFPSIKRLRARSNSFDWWKEKTLAQIKKNEKPLDAGDIKKMTESLERLDKLLGDKDLPSLREIINYVNKLPVKSAPAPPPTAATEKSKADPVIAPAVQADKGPKAAPVSDLSPQDALGAARKSLIEAAEAYLSAAALTELADPWYWKVSRLNLWFNISAPPPSQGGLTSIPAPSDDILNNFQTLLAAGKPLQALISLEDKTTLYLFWLDLQLASYEALKALDYANAASALQEEASGFAARLPALLTLSFDNGTPLVSEKTKSWLTQKSSQPEQQDPLKLLKSQAAGDAAAALSKLAKPEFRPSDERSLFYLHIIEAQLWNRLGRTSTAIGLADWLIKQIDLFKIEAWEPALAAEALTAVNAIYASCGPEFVEKSAQTAVRLALLNPEEALKLKN
jgi:type VI secretion system protein VasJ